MGWRYHVCDCKAFSASGTCSPPTFGPVCTSVVSGLSFGKKIFRTRAASALWNGVPNSRSCGDIIAISKGWLSGGSMVVRGPGCCTAHRLLALSPLEPAGRSTCVPSAKEMRASTMSRTLMLAAAIMENDIRSCDPLYTLIALATETSSRYELVQY